MIKKIRKRFAAGIRDKNLKEIVHGASNTLALRIVGVLIGYVFIIIISRTYGSHILGIYTLCNSLLIISSVVCRLGFDSSIVRFFAQNIIHDKWNVVLDIYYKMLKVVIPWGVFLSVVLFFSSEFIAMYFFHKPALADYFKIISFGILPMTLRFINSESYRGFKMPRHYAYSQHVSYFLYAAVLLGVISLFYKNDFLPNVCYVSSLLILSVSSTFLILKKIKSHSKEPLSLMSTKKILRISTPMMLSNSFMIISGLINTLMLGFYGTVSDVGVFSIILKVGTATSMILTSVNSIAAPKFAELHATNNHNELARVAVQTSKLNFWISLPVLLITFIFRDFILGIFGKEFILGANVLLFTLAGQCVNMFSGSVGAFLNMTGHQNVQRTILVASTIINIIACTILIPKYGLAGSAMCGMIFMISWNVLALLYIRIKLNVRTYYWPFAGKK